MDVLIRVRRSVKYRMVLDTSDMSGFIMAFKKHQRAEPFLYVDSATYYAFYSLPLRYGTD